jgi:hypothetical protein
MARKLLGILTGALLGYIWGWIWGWSVVDPALDLWALAAAFGALVGLGVGLSSAFWDLAGVWLSATVGLYLGWIARTLIFGDVPGGPGMMIILAGAGAGGYLAVRADWSERRRPIAILLAAVYTGFFGGFLVSALLAPALLGAAYPQTILGQAPAVLACGILGGALAAWRVP